MPSVSYDYAVCELRSSYSFFVDSCFLDNSEAFSMKVYICKLAILNVIAVPNFA